MKSDRYAFTLIELIFVIVIIGIITALAVPKFSNLKDNAKITAELATASSIQNALENCHGEWIVNDANFTCGLNISRDDLNSTSGYPSATTLGSDASHPLDRILKNAHNLAWKRDNNNPNKFYGPTYENIPIATPDIAGKPDGNDYWLYSESNGSFSLIDVP